jgi:transcriptional regulator with XRE-family HTH domain
MKTELKKLINQADYGQMKGYQVAAEMGVSYPYLRNILCGHQRPSYKKMVGICKSLSERLGRRISVEEVFPLEPQKEDPQ